jgi:hypothetical protein
MAQYFKGTGLQSVEFFLTLSLKISTRNAAVGSYYSSFPYLPLKRNDLFLRNSLKGY